MAFARLRVLELELTLADVNPAMAELRGLAHELRLRAEADAAVHGRALASTRAAA